MATFETIMAISQKNGNKCTSRPNTIIPGHIPKGCSVIPQNSYKKYPVLLTYKKEWYEVWQHRAAIANGFQCSHQKGINNNVYGVLFTVSDLLKQVLLSNMPLFLFSTVSSLSMFAIS